MTATDIANLALSHLGSATIADIDAGDTKEARTMALHWPQARKEVLRSRRWTCATARADLAQSGTQPAEADPFSYAFDLPCDFIRLLEVNNADASQYDGSFLLEGSTLLHNEDTVRIRYTFDNDDPTTWDALLVDAVALLLAAKAARNLTGSETVEANLRQQYERLALPKAATADGQQEGSGEQSPLLKLISRSSGARFRGAHNDLHGLYRDPVL